MKLQKILDILANNARMPIAILAREVNSNVKTVSSKIKDMDDKGIIIGYRISIDINKLKLEYFKILFYYRSISKNEEMRLLEYIKQLPQSIYYVKMIAPWDAELELIVKDIIIKLFIYSRQPILLVYYDDFMVSYGLMEFFPNIINNFV